MVRAIQRQSSGPLDLSFGRSAIWISTLVRKLRSNGPVHAGGPCHPTVTQERTGPLDLSLRTSVESQHALVPKLRSNGSELCRWMARTMQALVRIWVSNGKFVQPQGGQAARGGGQQSNGGNLASAAVCFSKRLNAV